MEKRTRTYTYGSFEEALEKSKNLTGLAYLEGMQNGEIPAAPAVDSLNINVNTVKKGKAYFDFVPEDFHYNAVGTVHGGVITTILDTAMGCTLMSTQPEGFTFTTLELKVNFIKAVTLSTGKMVATAKIIHAGRSTAIIEASLIDGAGKIYAHATSTCMILKKPE